MDETGGEGVDLVVEVGGQARCRARSRPSGIGGTIAQVGVLAAGEEPLPIRRYPAQMARIQGIYVGSRKDFER
jgi:D-arabinose 1-dehydrogenase-like Zn-dependent alcohol dehydrogenase